MVIERLHGLQATSITLNDRFTMLASAVPDRVTVRQRRRSTIGNYYNQNFNFRNRNVIEQIARRLEQQAKRQALRQRLGVPPGALRRFGSEGNLPVMWRSNSFGNLQQGQNVKNRVAWRHSNGNLNRSNSFSSLSGDRGGRPLRGFKRRGGGVRQLRGRFRAVYKNGRQNQGRVTWVPLQRGRRGRGTSVPRPARGQMPRGRGRGGINRNQTPKPVPTKEELDEQLDQYMAGSKAVLDQELDAYMKSAMELE